MTAQRVTLMDVANRAGVSRTTASFVLTGRRDMRIGADAEKRVLQAARELDYRPNLLARSLKSNRSQTVGLLSDRIASEPFAGEMIRAALTAAALHDHLLFIGEAGGDQQLEKQLINGMLDRGVSGFLYASMYTSRVRIPTILRSHPLVLVNCVGRAAGIPMVVPDETEAGRTAARLLLQHGHTDQMVLVGETPAHVIAATERLAGIEQVLGAQDLKLAGSVPTGWWPEPAHQAVHEYLASGQRPSAFICLNDRIAMGTYQAATDFGLSVPEDVSVISFDDSDLASWLQPQLTSLAIPHLELGRRGIELLLDENRPGGIQRLPMLLRERDSVGAPGTGRARRRTRITR